ncbi:MAG: transposase [Chitinophagaceae bacterium]|nr:transposase [Chitinophagaceae bacterium]
MNTTSYPAYWPQFYTATINKWKHLLSSHECKDIIIDSLKFLVNEKKIRVYAFVIMSNHIHLIWQPLAGNTPSSIQSSFMKYTAQQIIKHLQKADIKMETLKVNKGDRVYQV